MFNVIFAYMIISIVIGFDAISTGWSAALSLWSTSFISVFSGTGLRGSLYAGIKPAIAGLLLAIVFMALAQWLGKMFSVGILGNHFSGETWSGIGFVIGFVFTTKKFAVSALDK